MAAQDAVLGWKEYGSWFLSGLTLLVTVIWNISNRRYTDRKASDVRTAAFAFAAWKDLRDPVLARLREFEAKGNDLQALTIGNDNLPDLIKKIHQCGYALTTSHLALEGDLTRMRSREVKVDQWIELANGVVTGSESDWDKINTLIDRAVNRPTADECRDQLRSILLLVRSIGNVINSHIAIENASHDPDKF